MSLALEYTLTAADLRQVLKFHDERRWPSVHFLGGLLAAAFASYQFLNYGIDWGVCLTAALSIYLIFWESIFSYVLTTALSWSGKHPVIRMELDSEVIRVERGLGGEVFTWDTFASDGSAMEYQEHFELDLRQTGLFIPKRAFATSADMANFRDLVRAKLNDRFSLKT